MNSRMNIRKAGSALLLSALFAACGVDADNDRGTNRRDPWAGEKLSAPNVRSTIPAGDMTDVFINERISVIFDRAMASDTLTVKSFKLTTGEPAVEVEGTVIYANSEAVFWPAAHLDVDTLYTATIGTGVTSEFGVAMAAQHQWRFTTGKRLAPGIPVELGTAANFVILAKSGISTVPAAAITGNIGVSPAAASYITGFSLSADATNVFSTSPQVSGMVYAADYAVPTPSNLTTAVGDMETAFTNAAGRAPDFTELAAGNIGGMKLVPGVYKWSSALLIPSNLELVGSPTDVWIFQIAQDLTLNSDVQVVLSGGAVAKNVFWQVSGEVTLNTKSHLEGVVLSQTAVNVKTGATVKGRLLAQTAVTLDASTITQPAR